MILEHEIREDVQGLGFFPYVLIEKKYCLFFKTKKMETNWYS